jgi:hypothetical protein
LKSQSFIQEKRVKELWKPALRSWKLMMKSQRITLDSSRLTGESKKDNTVVV